MTVFEYILAAICLACIWGPLLYCMATPPRRLTFDDADNLLEVDRMIRRQRVERALERDRG